MMNYLATWAGSWLPGLGHNPHSLEDPRAGERNSGYLPLQWGQAPTRASGERVCVYAGRRGSGCVPLVKGGGCGAGVGMPRAWGGAAAPSALAAARELRASTARAPSALLAASSPALSIAPSLFPSLPPGGRGGAGEAAKRSGPALEECGSAEGADHDSVSLRFKQPEHSPGDPILRVADPALEPLEVIQPEKAKRAGTLIPKPDRHPGRPTDRQTDIHPKSTDAQREPEIKRE